MRSWPTSFLVFLLLAAQASPAERAFRVTRLHLESGPLTEERWRVNQLFDGGIWDGLIVFVLEVVEGATDFEVRIYGGHYEDNDGDLVRINPWYLEEDGRARNRYAPCTIDEDRLWFNLQSKGDYLLYDVGEMSPLRFRFNARVVTSGETWTGLTGGVVYGVVTVADLAAATNPFWEWWGWPEGENLLEAFLESDARPDVDLDGDMKPDAFSFELSFEAVPTTLAEHVYFLRGDVNQDGRVALGDVIYLLRFILAGGAAPLCYDTGDADDSGGLQLADAIRLLHHIFRKGPAPEEPEGTCGVDPKRDTLPLCEYAAEACPD